MTDQVQVKSSYNMWDAFEHILLFISLYFYSTSVALLLHQFVDKYYPGESTYNVFYRNADTLDDWQLTYVRGLMAAIMVSFPLFAFFFYRITKRSLENPATRELSARKKLTYFTMIVAFIILICNVISIVYNFISGNTTTNFLLHFLVSVGVSGIIFAYYLHQIREDRKIHV
jgi:hypothetical protein